MHCFWSSDFNFKKTGSAHFVNYTKSQRQSNSVCSHQQWYEQQRHWDTQIYGLRMNIMHLWHSAGQVSHFLSVDCIFANFCPAYTDTCMHAASVPVCFLWLTKTKPVYLDEQAFSGNRPMLTSRFSWYCIKIRFWFIPICAFKCRSNRLSIAVSSA